jgi:uncharacterized protein YbdZ (MbtH family)
VCGGWRVSCVCEERAACVTMMEIVEDVYHCRFAMVFA